MAKLETKIEVSIERAIHEAMSEVIQDIWEKHKVKIIGIYPEWFTYESVDGRHEVVQELRMDTRTFRGEQ